MFKRLAISLSIDIKNRDVFESLLVKHQIPINHKAMIPRRVSAYYASKGIMTCFYYAPVSEDYNKISLETPWHEHIDVNEYLNKYLDQFEGLSHVKSYFLDQSYLLLIFNGIIQHEDIVEFTPKTVANLAKLGLGVSYNHVYDE